MVKSELINSRRHAYHAPKSPRKIMKLLAWLSILLSIPVLAVSCNSPQTVTYFPVQKEPQTQVMTALLQGKLVVDNGSLRVNGNLIIWPYGYSRKVENNEIRVLDDKAQSVARVGDFVKVGGGVIPASFAEEKIGQKLPVGIEDPFWLMGDIVSK